MQNGKQPDMVIEVMGVQVASWSSGKDGEGVPPTQVHLLLDIPGLDVTFVTRLKSREATDSLINALIEHCNYVWPGTPSSEPLDVESEGEEWTYPGDRYNGDGM